MLEQQRSPSEALTVSVLNSQSNHGRCARRARIF